MKNLTRLVVLLAASGTALLAQDTRSAPTVTSTPPPPPPAAAPVQTPVDGLIHVQKLPTPAQITADAEAEGMGVVRMDQESDRIIVTYRYASGNTRTFAYTTVLPTNPDAESGASTMTSAPPPPPASPSYSVIYTEPAPVYYYPRYYDPYWPTTSLSIGLGFGRTFGGYGHYGYGHYGYGRGSYRGGWRH